MSKYHLRFRLDVICVFLSPKYYNRSASSDNVNIIITQTFIMTGKTTRRICWMAKISVRRQSL